MHFGPQVSRVYLSVLDRRMKALKEALHDGFGVQPGRVVQTSYEPIQFDEAGGLCGSDPTLGMDVHPGLRLRREQLGETAQFLNDLLKRMESIAGTKRRADCPAHLVTGSGTGFAIPNKRLRMGRSCACLAGLETGTNSGPTRPLRLYLMLTVSGFSALPTTRF